MTGKTRQTSGGRLAAAAALAAHLIYMAAAGPASAMHILEAADHGELAAEISATGVNRIALSHDRIRRVIRAPGGFVTEHDPETGELYLRPVAAGQGAEPEAVRPRAGHPVHRHREGLHLPADAHSVGPRFGPDPDPQRRGC